MTREWTCHVVETVTGRVVSDVPVTGSPTWERGLNQVGSLSVDIPLRVGIPESVTRALTTPWRFSLALSVGDHIVQAGPIVSAQYTDAPDHPTVTAMCTGIWGVLNRRLLRSQDHIQVPSESTDVRLTGLSLHTIAKRLAQYAEGAIYGDLPIVYPDDIAGAHERWYPSYDLAMAGERLQQLTQVQGGPDVEFAPRWVSPTHIEWVMRIGNPHLVQTGQDLWWEYGASLVSLDVTIDGAEMAHRVWVRGNGMERGLLFGYWEERGPLEAGYPTLDRIVSHDSVMQQSTLDGYARAYAEFYQHPTVLYQARVLADPGASAGTAVSAPALGEYAPGDYATFNVLGHHVLPDGQYSQRIIALKSSGDINTVELVLAESLGSL